jgi:hypothetical protein
VRQDWRWYSEIARRGSSANAGSTPAAIPAERAARKSRLTDDGSPKT